MARDLDKDAHRQRRHRAKGDPRRLLAVEARRLLDRVETLAPALVVQLDPVDAQHLRGAVASMRLALDVAVHYALAVPPPAPEPR